MTKKSNTLYPEVCGRGMQEQTIGLLRTFYAGVADAGGTQDRRWGAAGRASMDAGGAL